MSTDNPFASYVNSLVQNALKAYLGGNYKTKTKASKAKNTTKKTSAESKQTKVKESKVVLSSPSTISMAPVVLDQLQKAAKTQLAKLLETNKEALLMATCGFGKTEVAGEMARDVVDVGGKAIVFCHNQNSQLDNWYNRRWGGARVGVWKSAGKHSQAKWNKFYKDHDICLVIPAALRSVENLGRFEFCIIDEGHHYYGKSMSNEALLKLRQANPDIKTAVSTASGTKFIKANFPRVTVSMPMVLEEQERHNEKRLEAPIMELVSASKVDLNPDEDFTADLTLNKRGEKKITEESTIEDMERSLLAVLLRGVGHAKFSKGIYKRAIFRKWLKTEAGQRKIAAELDKTIIIAANIEATKYVSKYLQEHGIKHVVSESETDTTSQAMQDFKDDGKVEDGKYVVPFEEQIKGLVVVRRGNMAYDNSEVRFVIDLTYDTNPEINFQKICRLVRVAYGPRSRMPGYNKVYFKVFPNTPEWRYLGEVYMSLAMQLGGDDDFYRTFDGDLKPNTKIKMRRKMKELIERINNGDQEAKAELLELTQEQGPDEAAPSGEDGEAVGESGIELEPDGAGGPGPGGGRKRGRRPPKKSAVALRDEVCRWKWNSPEYRGEGGAKAFAYVSLEEVWKAHRKAYRKLGETEVVLDYFEQFLNEKILAKGLGPKGKP